ncbi:lipocalin family protein [Puia dinghuensis]|uniref:Lipoprotein n=1 Tax=Puia dinghuensis TaxID=1792502 RepID=A0A8J2U9N9_9BACT|nr:lipocalin family protein [Puia dinghuensis]GGA89122.1 hypothetical protein GCM10011511_10430 [Puia dinghuensis]
MKRHLYCYMTLAVMTAAVISCSGPAKPGAGLYIYNPEADGDPQADTLLTVASFLELRPDGTYTQDFGHFDYGNWNFTGTRLYLTNQRKKTYVYYVESLTKTEMELILANKKDGHFNVHLMPSSRPEKDPFSTYNNQWRIPATHKESDAEIRKRLFNHCQFWEAFFSWVDNKNESVVDVGAFPTPLKVYGNGFGLKHYDDLPAAWRSYFFDEEDCHKADTLIKHTFRRNKINWPQTDDDFKKLISGFRQLQGFLQ